MSHPAEHRSQAIITAEPSGTGSAAPSEPITHRDPLFARLGRFAYRWRRLILIGWLVLFVAGIGVGSTVFSHLSQSAGSASAESVRGANTLAAASPSGSPVIAVITGPSVTDPGTQAAVQRVSTKLAALPYVTAVANPYNSPDSGLRATDGHGELIVATIRKTSDTAAQSRWVDGIRSTLAGSVPGANIKVGGDPAIARDEAATAEKDLMRGEMIAMPILLVALLFVFRGVRAALLPLAAAAVTVAGAMLLLRGFTAITNVAPYAVDVIGFFGLALAVDYSLLMVNRFREERATGASVEEATGHTILAAGRTITFSALVVVASLIGLFVFTSPIFTSLALGGIATVLVALAAGLTLIPALLGTFGAKIKPVRRQQAGDGWFGRLARGVQRRPILVVAGVAAVLLGAGVPFLTANYSNGDTRVLPASMESRQAADLMVSRFPRATTESAVTVVGNVPASDPRVSAYANRIATLPGVSAVRVEQGLRGDVSAIDVIPAGQAQGVQAQRVVQELRADRPAYSAQVTGEAAMLIDSRAQIGQRLPWAAGLIALTTFVLLFLMTGSVLVPIKALLMNVLSLAATFGAMVWIFQDGHLSGLLGFTPYGAIELWIPTLAFVFAFGLSMDYEVFLLSRIKEDYEESQDSDASVANGLQRSGRIITSAAILVMIVFLGFATGQNLAVKQMGVALATAVAVDVTLVRLLLVPATMTLLGRANWWAPAPMRWLHGRFGLRESPTAAAARLLRHAGTTAVASAGSAVASAGSAVATARGVVAGAGTAVTKPARRARPADTT